MTLEETLDALRPSYQGKVDKSIVIFAEIAQPGYIFLKRERIFVISPWGMLTQWQFGTSFKATEVANGRVTSYLPAGICVPFHGSESELMHEVDRVVRNIRAVPMKF